MIAKACMKRHVDNHGKEKIQCEFCDRMFATQKAYKSHQEMHESSKYNCNVCKRVYSNKLGLTTHKKTAHQFELEF